MVCKCRQTSLSGIAAQYPAGQRISRVTDGVLDEVREWQTRALDQMYPIVTFDALRVEIRDPDSRMAKNKAVYVALGVNRDGMREVLGLWLPDNEGPNSGFR